MIILVNRKLSVVIETYKKRELLLTDKEQEVVGLIPQDPATFMDIDHAIFSVVIPFCRFKKGSCQFLVKECAEVLVNRLED